MCFAKHAPPQNGVKQNDRVIGGLETDFAPSVTSLSQPADFERVGLVSSHGTDIRFTAGPGSYPERPMTPLRQRLLDDMRMRNLSPHTQTAYVRAVASFAKHFNRSPELLEQEHIREYLLHLIHQKYAWDTYNQVRCALHFFYRVTLGKDWPLEQLPCAKAPQRLPVVLSRDEIRQFFTAARRLKARAMLMTAYAAGLRASEVVTLQVTDIDSPRMLIRVRQGKGQKDRYVMLSTTLLETLRAYWQTSAPRPGCSPARTRPSPSGRSPSPACVPGSANGPEPDL